MPVARLSAPEHELRMIFAAYESAGTGRKVEWPYEPERDKRRIELWGG